MDILYTESQLRSIISYNKKLLDLYHKSSHYLYSLEYHELLKEYFSAMKYLKKHYPDALIGFDQIDISRLVVAKKFFKSHFKVKRKYGLVGPVTEIILKEPIPITPEHK